jgi:hypothetical protein
MGRAGGFNEHPKLELTGYSASLLNTENPHEVFSPKSLGLGRPGGAAVGGFDPKRRGV